MKVILVWNMGVVDEVLVVNDDEVGTTLAAIEAANAKLEEDERIDRVAVKTPNPLDAVLDYIANP